MSDTKHTPGPWEWEREFEDAGRPGHHYTRPASSVLIIYGDGHEDCWRLEGASDANARLIAAAPELLEACKELAQTVGYSWAGTHWQCMGCHAHGPKPNHVNHEGHCPVERAEQAIAKAEGRDDRTA